LYIFFLHSTVPTAVYGDRRESPLPHDKEQKTPKLLKKICGTPEAHILFSGLGTFFCSLLLYSFIQKLPSKAPSRIRNNPRISRPEPFFRLKSAFSMIALFS
jgi:hypothetical protein